MFVTFNRKVGELVLSVVNSPKIVTLLLVVIFMV